ncbi:hypothetical protein BZL30_6425 [Mycobacterium kansasii]|uniref:Uncharacterized protein n=1 Tax=Mycobacterium kansasii TaxID=1768 RepID=A0A1V3WT58_MYCKA|nr:hypothetical protein BZL30_6425 [Mycobacterium kansasii]
MIESMRSTREVSQSSSCHPAVLARLIGVHRFIHHLIHIHHVRLERSNIHCHGRPWTTLRP